MICLIMNLQPEYIKNSQNSATKLKNNLKVGKTFEQIIYQRYKNGK